MRSIVHYTRGTYRRSLLRKARTMSCDQAHRLNSEPCLNDKRKPTAKSSYWMCHSRSASKGCGNFKSRGTIGLLCTISQYGISHKYYNMLCFETCGRHIQRSQPGGETASRYCIICFTPSHVFYIMRSRNHMDFATWGLVLPTTSPSTLGFGRFYELRHPSVMCIFLSLSQMLDFQ